MALNKDAVTERKPEEIKDSSLKNGYPQIACEWDAEKNGPLTEKVGHGSTQKVSWICPKGHPYEARIDHRTIMHSGCPYCAGKKPIVGENDLLTKYPDIAQEWDYDKNKKRPEDYLPFSNKEVFWKCPYCGFSYKKGINSRVSKKVGCTNCAKEKGTSFQEQSILFYLSKFTETKSRNRDFGREIDIYLPCFKTGIEYDGRYYHERKKEKDAKKHAAIENSGIRLIVMAEGDNNEVTGDKIVIRSSAVGRVNDPDLEWGIRELFRLLKADPPEIDLRRDQIAIKEQYIISRKKDNFAEKYPGLAKEWDAEKNGRLKPENFSCGSNHKAFFDCPVCGEVYTKKIYNRTIGEGCPVCAGKKVKIGYNDLASTYPKLAEEWDEQNEKTPQEITAGSDFYAWWKCKKCGHQWEATSAAGLTEAGVVHSAREKSCVRDLMTLKRYILKSQPSGILQKTETRNRTCSDPAATNSFGGNAGSADTSGKRPFALV